MAEATDHISYGFYFGYTFDDTRLVSYINGIVRILTNVGRHVLQVCMETYSRICWRMPNTHQYYNNKRQSYRNTA